MEEDEENLIYDDGDDDWLWGDEETEADRDIDQSTIEVKTGTDYRDRSLTVTSYNGDMFADHTLNASGIQSRVWNLNSRLGRTRFRVHLVMDHIATRLFSVLLVLADISLVLVSLIIHDSSDDSIYTPASLAIVSYFMVELMLRMFAWGREFFRHSMEVVDMVIIVISFIVTLVIEIATLGQHALYGKIIIAFRLVRIILLIRLYTGRKHLENSTRNLISQNKRRYVKDGFDLDITYITDRVIAMSFPSSGKLALYRNPIEEVSRFFNTKHPGHYKLYNLCSERSYDTKFFNDSVERVVIDDHNVPRLSQLLQFCHSVAEWMQKDEKNVVAIHCKGGKGRTGTCIAAWLLFSGQSKTAEKALGFFGNRRTDKAKGSKYQGVETPSQSRYVFYLEKVLKDMNGCLPPAKLLIFKSIKVTGVQTFGNKDGSDLRMEVIIHDQIVHVVNFDEGSECQVITKPDTIKLVFDKNDSPLMAGDVKLKFNSSNPNVPRDYDDCAFFFWFHTNFIKSNKLCLNRKEIGNSHKPKRWKLYTEKFSVRLKFMDVNDDVAALQ